MKKISKNISKNISKIIEQLSINSTKIGNFNKFNILKNSHKPIYSKKWTFGMNLFSPIKNQLLTKSTTLFAKIKHYNGPNINKYSMVQSRQFSSNSRYNKIYSDAIGFGILIGSIIGVATAEYDASLTELFVRAILGAGAGSIAVGMFPATIMFTIAYCIMHEPKSDI